jgi:hypothetical protein
MTASTQRPSEPSPKEPIATPAAASLADSSEEPTDLEELHE